jgi:hippurate hydrolase
MTRLRLSLAAAAVSLLATPSIASADELRDALSEDMPLLMELYRDLHAHPELSNQEFRTSAKLAGLMREIGFEVTEQVGGTGVVAILRNGAGPIVLLRTDMDGLPVEEQTGLPFASVERGIPESGIESSIMHACGHDTHMAAWIGAAQLLAERTERWSGTLVMIAQPAEELGEGSAAMLADGLFARFPKPEYVLTFHDNAAMPAGTIGFQAGFAMANVDTVDIVIPGVGGHGAYPHGTKDPVVLGSAIVMKLQTLASREINPTDPVVVTVGSFHAGTKHNIIPDEARLQLTVRSYGDETRKKLLDGIARIARGEAIAAGMPEDKMPLVTYKDLYTPAVYNSPDFTTQIMTGFQVRFGQDRVFEVPAVMGGEDFSRYRRVDPDGIKSLLFSVGGVPMDQYRAALAGELELPSLHSPFWAPDAEAVISTGAEALASATLNLMKMD